MTHRIVTSLFIIAVLLLGSRVAIAGDLLVAMFDTNSVLRYDETTGALVGTFVSSGSGGRTPSGASGEVRMPLS